MRISILALAAIGVFVGLAASPAQAQATRTWVSGVGDDANPCSRTAPCKTFAGAISKTAASGEINCIDSGAYGAVTIIKSITIDCTGHEAGVLSSATNGIVINAADADEVHLRHLDINGAPNTALGITGVRILRAGKVVIEDLRIYNFGSQGILDNRTSTPGSMLYVRDTTIKNIAGAGIAVANAATSGAVLDNVRSIMNGYGIAVASGNNVIVTNSTFSNNATAGISTDAGGQIGIDQSTISHNGTGVQSGGGIRLSNSTVSFNSNAFGGGGGTVSYGNNRVYGNPSNGPLPIAAGAASSDLGQQ